MNKTKAIEEIRRIFRTKRKLADKAADIDDADGVAAHKEAEAPSRQAGKSSSESASSRVGESEENLHNRREADSRQFHDGAITENRPEPVIRLLGALSRLFPSTGETADIDDTDGVAAHEEPIRPVPRKRDSFFKKPRLRAGAEGKLHEEAMEASGGKLHNRCGTEVQDDDHHACPSRRNGGQLTKRKKANAWDCDTEPDPLEPRPFKYTSTELLIPNLIHVAVIFLVVVFLLAYLYERHVYSYDSITGQIPRGLDAVVPSTPDDAQPPPNPNPNPNAAYSGSGH